jgi:succinoglycan biosynthesis transport protein ExoP
MDFWTYYRVLRRRRWFILILAALGALLAAALERPQRLHFEATATLTTSAPEDRRVSDFVAGTRRDGSAEQQRALALDILRSRTVAERVIQRLGLSMTPLEVLDSLRVRRDPGSDLIRLTASANTPQQAIALANAVADTAVAFHREINRRGVTLAREFIEKQVADVSTSLRQAEEDLLRFRDQKNLYTRLATRIGFVDGLQNEVARIDLSLRENQAKLATVRAGLTGQSATRSEKELVSNPVAQILQGQLVNLEVQLVSELAFRTEDHPEVVRLKTRMQAIKERLAKEVERVVSAERVQHNPVYDALVQSRITLETERLALLARREALLRVVGAVRRELPVLARNELEEARLQRQVDALRTQYADLQRRLAEIRVREQEFHTAGTLTLVDPARVAQRTSPLGNRPVRALGGAFLGLFSAVGMVLFAESVDNRLKTPEQAERLLGAPALGAIPRHNPPFEEGYRLLRASIWGAENAPPPRALAVTSPKPGEGVSTVVRNLARAFAEMGTRTLVVDMMLRRPAQHRLFFRPNERGVADILSGRATCEECLVNVQPNLWLLPAGAAPADPGPLFQPSLVRALLEDLRQRADVVVIDTPAAGAFADAYVVGPLADGVLLVLEAGRPPRGIEQQVRVRLHRVGARVLGVVVNKVPPDNVDSYFFYDRFHNGGKARPRRLRPAAAAGLAGLAVILAALAAAAPHGAVSTHARLLQQLPGLTEIWGGPRR